MSTPLTHNEKKLNIADLPGQQSDGCPVLGTELHEIEAELSVTSVTGGDAVGDSNSKLPSQHLAFINTNIISEANLAEARESIDGELTALQTASQSDGTGRVLGMNSSSFKNEQRTRVILSWKDSDVGSRSAGRTDPKEVETSDVVTSMHGNRGDSGQV